jgi:hypothetical protein
MATIDFTVRMEGTACFSRGRNRTKRGLTDDGGEDDGWWWWWWKALQRSVSHQKFGSIYNSYLWSYMTLRRVLKITHSYCLTCQYGGHPNEIASEQYFWFTCSRSSIQISVGIRTKLRISVLILSPSRQFPSYNGKLNHNPFSTCLPTVSVTEKVIT